MTVVEWGEGMVEQLADAHLLVRIERRDDDARHVGLVGHGGDWAAAAGRSAGGGPGDEGAGPAGHRDPGHRRRRGGRGRLTAPSTCSPSR